MECSYVVWVQFNSVTPEEFKQNLSRENLVVTWTFHVRVTSLGFY